MCYIWMYQWGCSVFLFARKKKNYQATRLLNSSNQIFSQKSWMHMRQFYFDSQIQFSAGKDDTIKQTLGVTAYIYFPQLENRIKLIEKMLDEKVLHIISLHKSIFKWWFFYTEKRF